MATKWKKIINHQYTKIFLQLFIIINGLGLSFMQTQDAIVNHEYYSVNPIKECSYYTTNNVPFEESCSFNNRVNYIIQVILEGYLNQNEAATIFRAPVLFKMELSDATIYSNWATTKLPEAESDELDLAFQYNSYEIVSAMDMFNNSGQYQPISIKKIDIRLPRETMQSIENEHTQIIESFERYSKQSTMYRNYHSIFSNLLTLSFILYIALLIFTKAKPFSFIVKISHFPTEAIIMIGLAVLYTLLIFNTPEVYFDGMYFGVDYTQIIFTTTCTWIFILVALDIIIYKIKDRRFLKEMIILRFIRFIAKGSQNANENQMNKSGYFLEGLQSIHLGYLFIMFILALLVLLPNRHFLLYNSSFVFIILLVFGISIAYIIYLKQEYLRVEENIRVSVEENVKSERMKVDLITNVSHDLKTPLTSIITYIELLKQEDNGKEANDYIQILETKAQQLKNVINDLFDMAKATSGNINLQLTRINLNKVIEQTVGDMSLEQDKQYADIVLNLPNEAIYIEADSNYTYRMIQNLVENAMKYSLKETRIFIKLDKTQDEIHFEIKNTSAYPIDCTKEQILERFGRADSSRSSDGHGLGLSIVQSFAFATGSQFDIEIDGDQFKAHLWFKRVDTSED